MWLFSSVTVISPGHELHRQTLDLLIDEQGVLQSVSPNEIPKGTTVVQHDQPLYVSPGWVDVGAYICDPGLEHRESLATALQGAAIGGFTSIVPMPNTMPVVQSKSQLQYWKQFSAGSLTQIWPFGALSQDLAGKDLAELMDMKQHGAVAFSDGYKGIQDSQLLLIALQYCQGFGGLVVQQPSDAALAGKGQMHEGLVSTQLGLKGIPTLAETLMVQRDLSILRYAGGKLHFHGISSAESVQLIRLAKKEGLSVTASVAYQNLIDNDTSIGNFNVNFKVQPPLRGVSDQKALLKGVLDDTIDIIFSNHKPLDEEQKAVEFPYAGFGAIGFQSFFGKIGITLGEKLPLDKLIEKIAVRPYEIFGESLPNFKIQSFANLSFFDTSSDWTLESSNNMSKSNNSPYFGTAMKGKPFAVVCNGKVLFT